ncbi:hypothetical protein H9X86_05520 [Pseudoflavonifractor capillosus]|uniref:hypothetical protein n=1 Tax=Pseudoflavonifractor capillosus TaxID=106588 RepID=UPI001959E7C3|nr:hypothetical protein [Pseudoflavonifractor capillosus]MBM6896826.1 hypothetical protein [Pseudoflavonifractor capillosus]
MSEDLLIRHCSPTLAGIKTGNLFEKYEMCSKIYSRQWQQGKSIEQLTVAG